MGCTINHQGPLGISTGADILEGRAVERKVCQGKTMMQPDEHTRRIERLLEYSEDDLLRLFEEEVVGDFSAAPKTLDELREVFRAWSNETRAKICSSAAVRTAVRSSVPETVAAVCDALGGRGFTVAAVLVVKIGVDRFCHGHWQSSR